MMQGREQSLRGQRGRNPVPVVGWRYSALWWKAERLGRGEGGVVSKVTVPQRCAHPHSQNL